LRLKYFALRFVLSHALETGHQKQSEAGNDGYRWN
jgi:hypothetical protein